MGRVVEVVGKVMCVAWIRVHDSLEESRRVGSWLDDIELRRRVSGSVDMIGGEDDDQGSR